MISLLTACFAAGAILLGAPAPSTRLHQHTDQHERQQPRSRWRVPGLGLKHPRDGPAGVQPERCASDIGVFSACATAGLPPAAAAAAVADTHTAEHAQSAEPGTPGGHSPWHTTAALLALGADPERAWSELHPLPGGTDLANVVTLSNASGAALAHGCHRIAARLRDEATDRATAQAERAGVLIAIPLTAFFLPAFFVLGLAPVVISLGTELLY